MLSVKSILMPLSSSGEVQERLLGALSVTAFFGAHLEVLHAQVSPRQFIPVDAVARTMPQKLLNELEVLADKYSNTESSELKSMFVKLCEQNDIVHSDDSVTGQPSAFWREVNGLRSELVGECGKVSDLIILPQPRSGKPTATFQAALMRSGKPILLVPRTMTTFSAERVLIAWNGSTEGSRAITHAIPILQQAKEIIIATSDSSAQCKPDTEELIRYLGRHGIKAESKYFDAGRRSTGEAILTLADSIKSELLIMGAYTHRRVHEQIFGGVTQHMVGHARLPVWMMH
ncbi:universal stress protein [Amphritea pacifica]|uniref:Universal stress protein n=1 Tax=Amphritea pacifica TaxID=2811233 RepID=A0ABS2W9C5_9GAMM|nr:universal stress protein [Amphritea pacifica]MBN0988310.1 universal stress protein [Amphritea pacifica]MBN1005579.1 universal stress protein [Amphritea pacifica]MBR9869341.1 universal stress protein [Oceanospirillales bacterium]MBR9888705.1 universal stress protein [Oceanospirillales bacterium]